MSICEKVLVIDGIRDTYNIPYVYCSISYFDKKIERRRNAAHTKTFKTFYDANCSVCNFS